MKNRLTFSEKAKLKSKKSIDLLFTSGTSFTVYPIRIVYIKHDEITPNKIAFSVSKRNFKLAVDRNRIKRIMREAYRLNQYDLNKLGYHIMFIYTPRKKRNFKVISAAIKKHLENLEKIKSVT